MWRRLNTTLFGDEILSKITIDGKAIDVKNTKVTLEEVKSYDLDEKIEKTTYTYVTKIDGSVTNSNVQYKLGEETKEADTLQEAVEDLLILIFLVNGDPEQ